MIPPDPDPPLRISSHEKCPLLSLSISFKHSKLYNKGISSVLMDCIQFGYSKFFRCAQVSIEILYDKLTISIIGRKNTSSRYNRNKRH